jgi:cell division protein FtsI (penicillin-binding protein 3)
VTINEGHIEAVEQSPSPVPAGRVLTVKFGFLALFFVLIARLAQVQIFDAEKYSAIAQKQYQSRFPLRATRGSIHDRNNQAIASNSMFVSFAADPKDTTLNPNRVTKVFSEIFNKPQSYYREKLRSNSRFAWLERQVHIDYAVKVEQEKLQGVIIQQEPKRMYHNDHVCGQLVGFTDLDNKGLAGIELEFDQFLKGTDGHTMLQRDALGNTRPDLEYPSIEPVNGSDVFLTIDLNIQAIAEEELKRGIENSRAESGIVVVLQPQTGEVLAIAQYPSMNPNNAAKASLDDQRLRAVTDLFEPGSVFKVVTASAALEYNLISLEKEFYAEHGVYHVPLRNGRVRRIIDTHPHDLLTFKDAMVYSSNIVMAKISDIIGPERFYKMARDFGFGIATSVELPGEVKGRLKKLNEWSATTLNTIAFGYEVGVTPMQIVAAYGAVANKGVLMKPYILKKIVDSNGNVIRVTEPQQIRQVISPKTAQTLTEFFVGVVENGTGKPAAMNGISVAGKTGTSKKYVEGKGKYEEGSYTASFVGYFPAEDPKMVCLVMLDNPRGTNYTGGAISAPIFKLIAERILNTTGFFTTPLKKNPPQQQELKDIIVSTSEHLSTTPRFSSGESVVLDEKSIPNVTGFSVRRAVRLLMSKQYRPLVQGSGIVVRQEPEPGTPAVSGQNIVLVCQPSGEGQ